MRYYIKSTKGKLEVLDLKSNKKLEGTGENIYAAVAKALFHAYSTYGTIEGSNLVPPQVPVNIYYKEGWVDINRVSYKYGCKMFLHKLNKGEKDLEIQNEQLSLF